MTSDVIILLENPWKDLKNQISESLVSLPKKLINLGLKNKTEKDPTQRPKQPKNNKILK